MNTRCCMKCIVQFSRIQMNDRVEKGTVSPLLEKQPNTTKRECDCFCTVVWSLPHFWPFLCLIVEWVKVNCLSSCNQFFTSSLFQLPGRVAGCMWRLTIRFIHLCYFVYYPEVLWDNLCCVWYRDIWNRGWLKCEITVASRFLKFITLVLL